VATGVRQGDIAGFAAIWAVVQTVSAKADVVLAFADGAILFAGAIFFRLIAHCAMDRTGHGSLQGKLYLTTARRGKARLSLRGRSCTHVVFGIATSFYAVADHISLCFALL
jgi:hypothetical protein